VTGPAAIFPARPTRTVRSPDGTPIAVFSVGSGPPLVLVHGTTGDHTTWRIVGPALAERFTLHAIDRRGRGASGDTLPYAIEREEEDVAAVVDALADEVGGRVDVVGHSYGGRAALGAGLRTTNLRRLVVYEGAPAPAGWRFEADDLLAELEALVASGDLEAVLETFMRRVAGMDDAGVAAFRANPVWPARVAAAPTIVRELASAGRDGPERFARLRQPTLLMAGTLSPPIFRAGSEVLAGRLAAGRLAIIEGAGPGAHHSHAERFVAEVSAFLAG
jgi:pimeloyl-ACP methyl ester carboxylesterase